MSPKPPSQRQKSTAAPRLTKQQKQRRDRRNAVLRKTVGEYLGEAGIEPKGLPEGVEVEGKTVLFTGADRRAVDDERVVDRVIGQALLDVLVTRTVQELGGQGLPLRALKRDGAVRLYDARHAVAVIRATRATVMGHGRTVHGNFLIPGDHWDTVRRWLTSSATSVKVNTARSPREAKPSLSDPPTVYTSFPDSASEEMRRAALAASWLLRHERTVEFGHTIVLRFAGGFLRLRPIPDTGPTRVPFAYERDGARMAGALRLKAPNDPMALEVELDSAPELIAAGWTDALIGYAELTSVPGAAATIPHQFTPTKQTRAFLASYVVGTRVTFRRDAPQLRPRGRTQSASALS